MRFPSSLPTYTPCFDINGLQLNADPNVSRQVYELGYVLGEFIVSRWGQAALVRLVQTNADVSGVLGLSPLSFEEAWHAWVQARYLS